MLQSSDQCPTVSIDLARVRQNTEAIVRQTGVPVIAVVKADAYGLGAVKVAEAIGDLVDAFYVFNLDEAIAGRFWEIAGRRTIVLHAGDGNDPDDFLSRRIRPVVWTAQRAAALRLANPILSIDTGQQRFGCPVMDAELVYRAGECREAMTHAVTLQQVQLLTDAASNWRDGCPFLHAAGSALLGEPSAWLSAVRPGMSLYRGSVRVSAKIVEVHDSNGPAGYSGFLDRRFGVIFAGYSNGIRIGPCKINGQLRRIIEVGMQSAFVELSATDSRGDNVILLADEPGIDETSIATAWTSSPQEVLTRLTKAGRRVY